jgi:hypothetical protein
VELEDLRWDPHRPTVAVPAPQLGDGMVRLSVPVMGPVEASVPAVPYQAWANRGAGGMRVWLPR